MKERVECPNSVTRELGYDVMDRIAEIASDSVTNTVYLYAASGCTTGVVSHVADGTVRRVEYTWTDDYRLAGVSVGGAVVAEYAYDVLGNLVAVANDEESFEILVDGGHSLADVAADGTPLRVYMRAPGVDNWLGFVDMTGSTPVPYFYVTDHLGSVLAVTDANGNLVERYEYDAWGKVLSVTDANGNALARSAIGNRILWQGREYSWTTGLYYFRNRWYDPTIGRWISKDPIGIEGGINLYEFCAGNPMCSTDPDGLCPDDDESGWWFNHFARPIKNLILAHWNRNVGRNEPWNLPRSVNDPDLKNWKPLPRSKSMYHNRHGANNRKYVSPDGHLEAVYNNYGTLVVDSYNAGTYNVYGPSNKIGHFFCDMVPYYLLGNSPEDAFDYVDRIHATFEAFKLWLRGE